MKALIVNRTLKANPEKSIAKAKPIPPAWREVWICDNPYGHIQATGLDEAGRKQYLYHERYGGRRSDPDNLLVFRENGTWRDARSEDVNAYRHAPLPGPGGAPCIGADRVGRPLDCSAREPVINRANG